MTVKVGGENRNASLKPSAVRKINPTYHPDLLNFGPPSLKVFKASTS